jgi:hypothetical protein
MALRYAALSSHTPTQQRAALKILLRSLHANLEKEFSRYLEDEPI